MLYACATFMLLALINILSLKASKRPNIKTLKTLSEQTTANTLFFAIKKREFDSSQGCLMFTFLSFENNVFSRFNLVVNVLLFLLLFFFLNFPECCSLWFISENKYKTLIGFCCVMCLAFTVNQMARQQNREFVQECQERFTPFRPRRNVACVWMWQYKWT